MCVVFVFPLGKAPSALRHARTVGINGSDTRVGVLGLERFVQNSMQAVPWWPSGSIWRSQCQPAGVTSRVTRTHVRWGRCSIQNGPRGTAVIRRHDGVLLTGERTSPASWTPPTTTWVTSTPSGSSGLAPSPDDGCSPRSSSPSTNGSVRGA